MRKGYVETSVTKCLILGAAGVGKTHLKHLLLKKDPPEQRDSTGLADIPVRAVSFSRAGFGELEDDWIMVQNDSDLMRIIGDTIKGDGVTMASSLNDVVSKHPKIAINNELSDGAGADQITPNTIPALVSNTKDTTSAAVIDQLIRNSNPSSGE